MLHAITAARIPLVRRKVARKVEKHPRLRMLARFRKLVCGLPLIRSRKAHRGRKMTMKRVFRILMKTYGLADPTHNEGAAWKFPTSKTTSAEILKLAKSLTYGELHPNSWYQALRCLKLRVVCKNLLSVFASLRPSSLPCSRSVLVASLVAWKSSAVPT